MISHNFNRLLYKSKEEIRDLQNQLLRKQLYRASHYSPYYRDLFQRLKIQPDKIHTTEDLEAIPLLYKRDYMKDPQRFRLTYPTDAPGPMPEKMLWNVHYTTGTTSGQPSPFYSTTHDYMGRLIQLARMCDVAGITANDTIANLFPLTAVPHIGYLGTIDYALSVGAKVFCALTGSPYPPLPLHRAMVEAVEMIEAQRATVLSGLPSFVRRIIMRAEEEKRDYSSVRECFLTGEACPEGMRQDIRRRLCSLRARKVNILTGLGFTEMQGTTIECCQGSGMHIGAPDLYFFEICDESSGKRLPDGEQGLLVISHLNRTGTCFLRYVVGDLTSIVHEKCPHCGRSDGRIVAQPVRTMELINVKGTLINPDILKSELTRLECVEEYQVVFTKENLEDPYSSDKITVRIALEKTADQEAVSRAVKQCTQRAIEMTPEVCIVDKNDIFDTTKALKCQRIIDERPSSD